MLCNKKSSSDLIFPNNLNHPYRVNMIFLLFLANSYAQFVLFKIVVSEAIDSIKSRGDNESHWKIPYLILISPNFSQIGISFLHKTLLLLGKLYSPEPGKANSFASWGK